MRDFCGHPLIAYTIAAAREAGFHPVVCTDDGETAAIAERYGVHLIYMRSPSADDEADIVWVKNVLHDTRRIVPDAFAILRPTSPFRTAATIRRAYEQFIHSEVHSIRAVEPVKQHPGKMWWCNGPGYPLTPVCDAKHGDGTPWHSSPTQTLPPCYVQNASLEMAWTFVVRSFGTISGRKVAPFFTKGYEGIDLNTEEDWQRAEQIAREHPEALPRVD